MTRLEQVGRTRHFLALRERLRHGHENTVAPNDFTKTEKVFNEQNQLIFLRNFSTFKFTIVRLAVTFCKVEVLSQYTRLEKCYRF